MSEQFSCAKISSVTSKMLEWKSGLTQQKLLPMIILFFSGKEQCRKKLIISKISVYETERYVYFC